MKLRWDVLRLALGIMLFFMLAMPVIAENATLAGSFSVPLIITNVAASGIGTSYAGITWDTNGNATSQVFYDTQLHGDIADYAYSGVIDHTLVTRHSLQVSALSPSTTYHYRVKSAATVGGTELVAISDDATFSTGSGIVNWGGGGGGGGGTTSILTLSEVTGLTSSTIIMGSDGTVQIGGQITTFDGRLSITVNAGTQLLNSAGQPITLLSFAVPLPSMLPPSQNPILLVYDLGPAGTTFTPPITLTMHYNPATLPPGVFESTLYIAYWSGSEWQALQSTVDTKTETVSALLSHFSLYALMGKMTTLAPTPTPTPLPATTIPAPISSPTPPTPPSYTPIPASPKIMIVNWWLVIASSIAAAIIIIGVAWFLSTRRRTKKHIIYHKRGL